MPKFPALPALALLAAAPFAALCCRAADAAPPALPAFVKPASGPAPAAPEPAASATKSPAPSPAAKSPAPAVAAKAPPAAAPAAPLAAAPVAAPAALPHPPAPSPAPAPAHTPAAAHSAPVPSALPAPHSPEEALQRLVDGNARYASGHTERPHQSIARRVETAAGQSPFAVIVTCSDSRVVPELYFDQGIGDLFVVRDAGHTLNDHVIGSVEYAVEHLHARIVLVVGHEKCGAVAAAVAGGHADGRISTIVDAIRPAVRETRNQNGDRLDNAVRGHSRRVAKTLAATGPILSSAVASGHLKVFAARYDLASGRVELLP